MNEPWRPALHFTPEAHWINDPNGLVHHDGTWHLFFQYHPHSMVWGPMHWGHASSTDLVHWTEWPIALAPDADGQAFSGSAVVDERDTSGLAQGGTPPWVAIFTRHRSAHGDVEKREDQHLAVSHDRGTTWSPVDGNPALPNPGHIDFRDPKVRWLPERRRWLMSLAVGDHVAFHSSPDLRHWTHESDFHADLGAGGGVWECPDLFPLPLEGEVFWVLLVSLTQGGPNGGSATRYLVGRFDGHRFEALEAPPRWLDHGPDHYAGVTWNDAPDDRCVLVAWMNNWQYARDLPTSPWRGAMTLPRELALRRVGGQVLLANLPAVEIDALPGDTVDADANGSWHLDHSTSNGAYRIELDFPSESAMEVRFHNDVGDTLSIGFDPSSRQFFIDRRSCGLVDFHPHFPGRHVAPRVGDGPRIDVVVYVDASSVELFADGGLSTLTSLVFPRDRFSRMLLSSRGDPGSCNVRVSRIRSILASTESRSGTMETR